MSWNVIWKEYFYGRICQPPCEAVSWNNTAQVDFTIEKVSLPVRLWVEILLLFATQLKLQVSLPVRLWVEMIWWLQVHKTGWSASLWGCELKYMTGYIRMLKVQSASLWGCELKYPEDIIGKKCEGVSLPVRLWVEMTDWWTDCRRMNVSLPVRLWVEIIRVHPKNTRFNTSASLWGCELKLWIYVLERWAENSQPPCEAVSWNDC